jgi:hypothetical protein
VCCLWWRRPDRWWRASRRLRKVLKSIGAWEHQHAHICLNQPGDGGVPLSWKKCDLNSGQQQFSFK